MKIALIGYGKMGKMIEQIAKDRGHEIVSIIDVDNQEDFDSPEFASADVAIEFTAPQAAYGNYLRAFAHNVKVVSVPQFRGLTHNLLHDGHIGSTARLLETERLTGRDGLQLVRVTTGHGTTATGRNQGVCPCHVGIAHH